MSFNVIKLGQLLATLTDYHANGAYKALKENVELLDTPDYALMIRTTNFENDDFTDSVKYISKSAYDFLSKSKVYPTDIIMNKIANAGSVYLMPDLSRPVSLAMNLFLLRVDNNKANPIYVYIFLKINESYVKQFANGSVTKTITKDAVRNLDIVLPPRTEQDKIARSYQIISNKINNNNKINQTLEQMAQALFKSWFVDFEPVKAKITALEAGGSQEDAMLAAMTAISGKDADALAVFEREHPEQYAELKATAGLFPSAMQESELGDIPEGWKFQPFGELLSHTIGGDWGKDESDDKHKMPVRIIRGTDIPNIKSCQDSNVPFRYVEEKKLKTRSLNAGDIVIEVSGGSPTQPTGRSIYVTDEILKRLSLPVEPASFCRLFRPKSMELGMVLGLYLEKIYQDGKMWLYQNQSTGISNFQTKVFLENEIVAVAPSEILKAFYKISLPYVKLMRSSENIKLAQLRDALLPKLLSGEITLPEAEQAVSEAENV
ncbi:type I restriction enzyme S subunit [Lelliottia nimipressuralis]|uniref:restriction endonuclease subunit S n=1 Tax=Lelliottia nimipressuralis TaxID=69220 RepID=UPI003D257FB9